MFIGKKLIRVLKKLSNSLGAFSHIARTAQAQRAHSANYYGVYPGNIAENQPPTEACMIKFLVYQEGLQGAEFRTLEPMAGIRLKKIFPGVPAGAVGCRIQDPGTHGKQQANSGGKQPTFRTARAARCAPHDVQHAADSRQDG